MAIFRILAKLSEKFGSVLKMPPIYKWFYAAEMLAAIASLAHLTQASALLSAQPDTALPIRGSLFQANTLEFALVFYYIPLTIALTIGLVITWKYWGWLITDRKR